MSERYRVGPGDSRAVLRDGTVIAWTYGEAEAALIVKALNALEGAEVEPEVFRDRNGDRWHRGWDGRYHLESCAPTLYSLAELKARHGEWIESAPGPKVFRDEDGEKWRRGADGFYRQYEGGAPWALAEIRAAFGEWKGE